MDTQQQPLHGRLEDVHFSEILLTISQRKETGVLHVTRYRIEKDIYFQDGRIVFAKSNDPDERLGELVLKSGKVSYRHIDESSRKVVPGLRLGTILVQEGYLKASDLYLGVVQQVEEIVYSLFDWSEGTFAFRSGELPTKEVITLSISTPDIILKGISRVWRWSWVRDWVGPLNTVYVRKEDWESIAKKMSITPQIEAMVHLLEQPRLLEEILDKSEMSNFETCKLLWALLIIGLIQPAMAQIATLQMPLEPEVTSDIFMIEPEDEEPALWPHDDTPPLTRQALAEDVPPEPAVIQQEPMLVPAAAEEKVETRVEPPPEESALEISAETETQPLEDTQEVAPLETESQALETSQEVLPAEIESQPMETPQEVPAVETEETLMIPPPGAEMEAEAILMANTLAAVPVEVSFSDLAEITGPATEPESTTATPQPQDRWEENIAMHVKNLNEVHRFLFEMLRMEMGPSISNLLARILNKVSAQHPLVFDGVKMNEFGELDGAALESNIQGNLADRYSEAFNFLLQEEREMMQSFLDRKRAEAIETGMNRILEKQKVPS